MAAEAPRSAEPFQRMGQAPDIVGISESQRVEGCVTRLSARPREVPES